MVKDGKVTRYKRIAIEEGVYFRLVACRDKLQKNSLGSTVEWLLSVRGD